MSTSTPIERLRPEVINRIAAGEVIHRPANALKELLENSLDAGATHISITASQGGLKLLQIQDNGHGIRKADLELVCERFTTSKLRTFEDLREIASFGFRGEALASISHVAHVTITSKTKDEQCAYKASYRDGNDGTQIVVEDLFYNLHTRKQALKNTSEQYQRIIDVVQKYAVHYAASNIGFVCKKYRESSCDVSTTQASSQLDAIRVIYGRKLADELLAFEQDEADNANHHEHHVKGLISNANYNMKKSHFILFINNRLVDCPALKRACDYIYSLYLPKHTHPFIYLSIDLPPSNVDVNVHPTKREVHFLYEDDIIESITQAMETRLKGCNESRSFPVQSITTMLQTQLPVERSEPQPDEQDSVSSTSSTELSTPTQSIDLSQTSKKRAPAKAPNKLVRTDHRVNTMDKYYFLDSQQSKLTFLQTTDDTEPRRSARKRKADEVPDEDVEMENEEVGNTRTLREPKLSSVQHLKEQIRQQRSERVSQLLRAHTFVGVINCDFALIQHQTELYAVRHREIAFHYFYERVIEYFGETQSLDLPSAFSIRDLVLEALKNPDNGYDEEDGPREQLADEIQTLLASKGSMLKEYFGLDINDQGMLHGIPLLLETYEPSIHALPEFVFQLATDVNWEEEEDCFRDVASVLAYWYGDTRFPNDMEHMTSVLEHVLFPAYKKPSFTPPRELNETKMITPVSSLTNLYKIFERC